MKVLIACEFSGRVRDAFLANGHDAVSCDLRPTEVPGPHIQGDARDALRSERWDLTGLHPNCDDTAVAGARWFPAKVADGRQAASLSLIRELWDLGAAKKYLEQPRSITHRVLGPVSQTIQPWQFGHPEKKATCLWIRGLPNLTPTKVMPPPHEARVHRMSLKGGKEARKKNRARTLPGIAQAMADQWGPNSHVDGCCDVAASVKKERVE